MHYGELKVEDGVFVPKTEIEYSLDNPFQRVVKVDGPVAEDDKLVFDENYPYLDNSFKAKWNWFLGWFFLWGPVMWVNRLHFGYRVKGKEVLKKYKAALKDGALAVCNHVYPFDAICVTRALRPLRRLRIPMLQDHFNGNKRWMLVNLGGVPLPHDMSGLKEFNNAFDEYHRRKDWMLVFPEAVRWNNYKPIRPFRKGAFTMAYRYGIPVVPCVINFRPRKGIYRLFGSKDTPCYDITICEPIVPDTSASRRSEVDRLRVEAHARMEKAAGILVNPWPSVPSDE